MAAPTRSERLAIRRANRRWRAIRLAGAGLCALGLSALLWSLVHTGPVERVPRPAVDSTRVAGVTITLAPTTTTTTTVPRRPAALVDPASVGKPWGIVRGLLTFRGNPTRSYHGAGPVPSAPAVRWKFPDRAMCSESSEFQETTTWCGSGWTGQPAVFERDGRTWVVFGAYDRKVHFLDAVTGERILPDFSTGDLVKGSVTVDPDGFPIVYVGSRDSYLRAIAIDRPAPTELWKLGAHDVSPTQWNDDWDGSPLVIDDFLVEGGENSQFHIVRLNRAYGADGLVTVDPSLVFNAPGWDAEQLRDVGNNEVSIEDSVAIVGDTAYFTNSGGLLQGWDLSSLRTGTGTPARTFRFWLGDDADASVVVDADGFLYVGVEHERGTARSREIGQLVKIDPRRPDNPVVWSVADADGNSSGTWSTPAVVGDTVIWPTRLGRVLGLDRATGAERWTVRLPAPLLGSPVVVDGVWIQGDCSGVLHGFDVRNSAVPPPELWTVKLGGCIEATPAVWNGAIYVGTRSGFEYALANP